MSLHPTPPDHDWMVPISSPATPSPRRLPKPGVVEAPLPWGRHLQTWVRRRGKWVETSLGARAEALSMLPSQGARRATLTIDGTPFPVCAAPCCVLSSIEPALSVLVADHPLTRRFVAGLRKQTDVPVIPVPIPTSGSDIWMQDCIEVLAALSAGPRLPRASVALTGLRRAHDQGLDCAALDRAAPAALGLAHPETVFFPPGNSLPKRRWIDWYGNLEATPPLPGYPYGRLLVGRQNELEIHTELLSFLQKQEVQWPPVTVDVGMLAIGHVDEVVAFLPANTPRGWMCAVISPRLGRQILAGAVEHGGGKLPIPTGKGTVTDAQALFDRLRGSDRTLADEQRAEASVGALVRELGLADHEILRFPVLLANGVCLLPNPVNGIMLNGRYLAPDPLLPEFRENIEKQFGSTSARLVWMDSVEPFHVRGGELHCGTQVVRRFRTSQRTTMNP